MREEIVFLAPLPALRKRTRLAKMVPVMRDAGHGLRFFGWEREAGEARAFAWNDADVDERILMRGGGYASRRARALYPLWMLRVFLRVLRLGGQPLVFCLGWETAFPARLAAAFTGARIVFDDADRFSLIVRLPGVADRALRWLEEWTSRHVALHVIPGFSRYEWRHDRMVVLRNSPREADFRTAKHARPERPEGTVVLYANGWIGETRGAPVFLRLLDLADDSHLALRMVVAGRVDGPSARRLLAHPHVLFNGEVTQREALSWYGAVDAVLTFYDPKVAINRKAESNKWGDAVAFGCPIIVNTEVETARHLIASGAAWAVPYEDAEALFALVRRLAQTPEMHQAAARATASLMPQYPAFDTQLTRILQRLSGP